MRIVLIVIALCVINANAFFVGGRIGESRLQSENVIYKPAGIVALSIESGIFDESENSIDYSMSFELKRFGYSYNDGDDNVAFWSVGLKPGIWTFSFWQMYVQGYLSLAFIVAHDEFESAMEEHYFDGFNSHRLFWGSGLAIGYRVQEKLSVGLSYDINTLFIHDSRRKYRYVINYSIAGIGFSVQYNLF